MLSLASASQTLEDKAINRFRPWWEVLTFYSLNGLLMAVLFALAGVTISGTYEIWCFPLGNDTAVDLSSIHYANARCSRIFGGQYLIYFPHGLFLEWAILFSVHLLWFKLPATLFLFQELSEVFSEFSSIKPVEYNTEKRAFRGITGLSSRLTGLQLNENRETKEKIYHTVDHLKDILKRNNNVFWFYGLKTVFLAVSSASVVVVLSIWLSNRQWHASFACDLSLYVPEIYREMTCSLPAAPFLYGLMIINIIFAFGICLCNFWGIVWLLNFNCYTYKHYFESFSKWQFLVQQPGFQDFCFCLNLTTFTSKDGSILGDVIYSSFKVYQKSQKSSENSNQDVVFKAKFSSMFYQANKMAQKLGLEVKEGVVAEGSLLSAIANTVGAEKSAVCDAIAEELVTNSSVYKDLVDIDLNCPEFEECIDLLKYNKKCPKEFQHYTLMATCNAFSINIVVLCGSLNSWYYKVAKEPSKVATKYLLFVQPNYYTATRDDPKLESQHKDSKELFVCDAAFRKQLKNEALESWNSVGKKKHHDLMSALYPTVIPYGTKVAPSVKQPTNILSDVFVEMGHNISKLILDKVYIHGRH